MYHPLKKIPDDKRNAWFWFLLTGTLVLMALLNWVGAPLITQAAPYGIISYELAGAKPEVEAILDSWDQEAQLHAAFSLGFDYLFMLAYSTTIALACLWAADALAARGWPLAWLGAPLAWGQWLAALLDALENLALTLLLFTPLSSPWPGIARWSAVLKFTLVFAGMVYSFLGLSANLMGRFASRSEQRTE